MGHLSVEELISGLTNVEATLRQRHGYLNHEVRLIEGEIGRAIQRREALYKERDQARLALAAIGAELEDGDA
jgi:hypothetical protein